MRSVWLSRPFRNTAGRDVTIIDRTGTGGKAGVLNDALKMATGDISVSMMRMPCLKRMHFTF